MSKLHTHQCSRCRTTYNCAGDRTGNVDGSPDVICSSYHVRRDDLCGPCTDWIYGDGEYVPAGPREEHDEARGNQ